MLPSRRLPDHPARDPRLHCPAPLGAAHRGGRRHGRRCGRRHRCGCRHRLRCRHGHRHPRRHRCHLRGGRRGAQRHPGHRHPAAERHGPLGAGRPSGRLPHRPAAGHPARRPAGPPARRGRSRPLHRRAGRALRGPARSHRSSHGARLGLQSHERIPGAVRLRGGLVGLARPLQHLHAVVHAHVRLPDRHGRHLRALTTRRGARSPAWSSPGRTAPRRSARRPRSPRG